jgi:5-methylcytosine-specific restriction endonuclease McrA
MAFLPQPKPVLRVIDRAAYKREADKKAQAFRQAVWKRDNALCRHCGRFVIKTGQLLPNRGEIHHRHGRNVRPEDRYNVDMAVLLCALCHSNWDVIQKFRREA